MVGGPDVGRAVDLVNGPVDVLDADHIGLVASRGRGNVRGRGRGRGFAVVPVRARPTVCVARDGRRVFQEVLFLVAATDVLRSRLVQPLKGSTSAQLQQPQLKRAVEVLRRLSGKVSAQPSSS